MIIQRKIILLLLINSFNLSIFSMDISNHLKQVLEICEKILMPVPDEKNSRCIEKDEIVDIISISQTENFIKYEAELKGGGHITARRFLIKEFEGRIACSCTRIADKQVEHIVLDSSYFAILEELAQKKN